MATVALAGAVVAMANILVMATMVTAINCPQPLPVLVFVRVLLTLVVPVDPTILVGAAKAAARGSVLWIATELLQESEEEEEEEISC